MPSPIPEPANQPFRGCAGDRPAHHHAPLLGNAHYCRVVRCGYWHLSIYIFQRLSGTDQKIDEGLTAMRQELDIINQMISALYLHLLGKPVLKHPASTVET